MRNYRWMVLFLPDGESPWQVTPLETEAEARLLYENLRGNWTEVYLCRLHGGPPDQVSSQQELPKQERVMRYEDMSPQGRLSLHRQDDGDVIVSVMPDHEKYSRRAPSSVEFCIPYSGGGQSKHTHKALVALMVAIECDNAERPQKRGEEDKQ